MSRAPIAGVQATGQHARARLLPCELPRGAEDHGWGIRSVEMTEAFARITCEQYGLEGRAQRTSAESEQSLQVSYNGVVLADLRASV